MARELAIVAAMGWTLAGLAWWVGVWSAPDWMFGPLWVLYALSRWAAVDKLRDG